jgi:hypothetical protein
VGVVAARGGGRRMTALSTQCYVLNDTVEPLEPLDTLRSTAAVDRRGSRVSRGSRGSRRDAAAPLPYMLAEAPLAQAPPGNLGNLRQNGATGLLAPLRQRLPHGNLQHATTGVLVPLRQRGPLGRLQESGTTGPLGPRERRGPRGPHVPRQPSGGVAPARPVGVVTAGGGRMRTQKECPGNVGPLGPLRQSGTTGALVPLRQRGPLGRLQESGTTGLLAPLRRLPCGNLQESGTTGLLAPRERRLPRLPRGYPMAPLPLEDPWVQDCLRRIRRLLACSRWVHPVYPSARRRRPAGAIL